MRPASRGTHGMAGGRGTAPLRLRLGKRYSRQTAFSPVNRGLHRNQGAHAHNAQYASRGKGQTPVLNKRSFCGKVDSLYIKFTKQHFKRVDQLLFLCDIAVIFTSFFAVGVEEGGGQRRECVVQTEEPCLTCQRSSKAVTELPVG